MDSSPSTLDDIEFLARSDHQGRGPGRAGRTTARPGRPVDADTSETMPSYVILTEFTRTGIERVAESPDRTEAATDMIESLGGELREFFVVMGRYDGVLVVDFPDDETAARAALALGQSGNVTTETLRAFDLDEFREIVDGIEEVD